MFGVCCKCLGFVLNVAEPLGITTLKMFLVIGRLSYDFLSNV
jgi:hypothetical protein